MNKNSPNTAGSRGSIICTASNAGLYPFPISPLYAASKFAVIGLVRSLADPLAEAGIQINGLAPAVFGMFTPPTPFHCALTPELTFSKKQTSPRVKIYSAT